MYQQNLDLIQVGAYQAGANPDLDEAIRLRPEMEVFLRQGMHDHEPFANTQDEMVRLMKSGGVEVLEKRPPPSVLGKNTSAQTGQKKAASVRFARAS